MKKIKNIQQLRSAKARIAVHQQELANKIGNNWKELKESLKPVNMAKDIFRSVLKNKTEENLTKADIFKSTFKYGLSLLAKKVSDRWG